MQIEERVVSSPFGINESVGYVKFTGDAYWDIGNSQAGCISFYVKSTSAGSISIGTTTKSTSATWQRIYFSISVNSQLKFTSGEYYLYEFKLETSQKPTAYTPTPEEATSFYLNTIYDTSGYSNNGTVTDSTCPSWSSESPRYQGCYKFDTSKYITIDLQDTSGFANSYSISWWGNASAINSKMFWGFGDGNRLNLYCGWLCNTGDGQNNPFYKPGTTTNTTIPSVNVWHHYVMTGDGTTVKYYLDGVLYGTAKTYKPITGKTIYINGWNTATEYKIDGCISDFRVYATTLSADDVKELYQSVASISNTGVLATYEFVEEEI